MKFVKSFAGWQWQHLHGSERGLFVSSSIHLLYVYYIEFKANKYDEYDDDCGSGDETALLFMAR